MAGEQAPPAESDIDVGGNAATKARWSASSCSSIQARCASCCSVTGSAEPAAADSSRTNASALPITTGHASSLSRSTQRPGSGPPWIMSPRHTRHQVGRGRGRLSRERDGVAVNVGDERNAHRRQPTRRHLLGGLTPSSATRFAQPRPSRADRPVEKGSDPGRSRHVLKGRERCGVTCGRASPERHSPGQHAGRTFARRARAGREPAEGRKTSVERRRFGIVETSPG